MTVAAGRLSDVIQLTGAFLFSTILMKDSDSGEMCTFSTETKVMKKGQNRDAGLLPNNGYVMICNTTSTDNSGIT